MGHTDTPQYSPYCGKLIQLHFSIIELLENLSPFPVSNFMKIYYLHFPLSKFVKIYSLSQFSSIEFHESLLTISIFQYRISWKFVHYLHFPVSNFMKVCPLSQFSSIEFHESFFTIPIFQYRISWKFVHYLHFPVSNFMKVCSLISVFRYRISRKCARCFLMLLRGIVEDTDVPCGMRVFLHLLAGMAPKLAGCDVFFTKYTEILWKPLKQFLRYDGHPVYWRIWRKCYNSSGPGLCLNILLRACDAEHHLRPIGSIHCSGKFGIRRNLFFDFIPDSCWDTRSELFPL